MNKQLLSFGISLAVHLGILMLAFNSVFLIREPSSSNTVSLVHVKIDSRPYHTLAHEGVISHESHLAKAPEMELSQMSSPQVLKNLAVEHFSTTKKIKEENSLISNENFVTVVKEKAPQSAYLAQAVARNSKEPLIKAQELFKNLAPSASGSPSLVASTPITSDYKTAVVKTQSLQNGPSAETMVSTHQGQSPRISFERSSNPSEVKSFLGYDLRTYEDPEDKGKYFRLVIRVGEVPGALAAIPKEIIFLVDASNSIGPETLKEFKKGLESSFSLLGPQDKFNLMIFKNNIVKMSNESLSNNPANIQRARDFLAKIRSGLDTDIYSAVLQSIDLQKTMKPTYILLLSDGEPTVGIKLPQQVINQINQTNKGKIPVFGLGAGAFLDKYLMNFLAFTNRGWSEFAFRDTAQGVVNINKHIKDPVLLNLRYYVSGLNENEIYPKLLPDLFKGSQFELYGRYTDEKAFYFQLYGDSYQDVKQYLITDDISSAPKADRRIAQEWAIRKIYHLIGLFEYNKNNQALVQEIKTLAKKFNLKIPTYEVKK